MFQNISDEFNNEEYYRVESAESNKKVFQNDKLKEILKLQNIAVYIISFFVAMIGFGPEFTPFAIAIFAASCSNLIPASCIFVSAGIGTYIGFGKTAVLMYLLTTLIFIVFIAIRKPVITSEERNEKIKLGKYLFFSCIIAQMIKVFFTDILIYNVLLAIATSIATYIFYKIFVNSLIVIKDFKIKTAFTVEEVLGASLILAIAISNFGNFLIFGFSVKNILCILLVLILGWKNGILVGATSGITIGIALGIIGTSDPLIIAAFAISGMIAGILNKFGKIGVIIGFVLGNIVFTFFVNGNTQIIIYIKEILIASLGLLLLPKNIHISIEDLIGKTKFLPVTREKVLDKNKNTIYKLNSVSETISDIARTYENAVDSKTSEKSNNEIKDIFIENLINNLENYSNNIIYEDLIENKILNEIFDILSDNKEFSIECLITIFEKNNNFIVGLEEESILKKELEEIVKIINNTHKINGLNYAWKKKINQSRKNISTELDGVSKVICSIVEDISEEKKELFFKKEEEIEKLLKQKDIIIQDIDITKNKDSNFIIKIFLNEKDNIDSNVKKIEKILSKSLNTNIALNKVENNDVCMQIYGNSDKFNLQIGIAKTNKNKSSVSGDSFIKVKLDDGKYLVAISDGMGSGPDAQKCSKVAIKMLERLLKAGFDKETSLGLINSSMILNTEEEMYATLDIAILDLVNGKIEFIKNGACKSFIKNNDNIDIVESISLPAGIIENVDLIVYEKIIEDNDILIMCSDGILDSNKEESKNDKWFIDLLKNINTLNVQKIADIILSEAIDNGYGIAKDDMTVIVAKISKKVNII